MTTSSTVAYELLILMVINSFAKCSHLEDSEEPIPEEHPLDGNFASLDNHEDVPANQEDNRRSCMRGKLWLLCFFFFGGGMFLITSFLPNIFMLESGVYSNFGEGIVSESIKNLTSKVGFSFSDVLISKSQRDANNPNAYLAGIINQKIFVTETIIKWMSANEICAVVGHELGHWVHNDLLKGFFASLVLILLLCLIMRWLTKRGLSELGFENQMPVCVIVLLTTMLFKPVQVSLSPVINILQRSFETDADCYSAQMGYPISETLAHLMELAKQTFESAKVYSLFYESHPPLSERIDAVRKCLQK